MSVILSRLHLYAYQDYNVILVLRASGWAWKHMGRKGSKEGKQAAYTPIFCLKWQLSPSNAPKPYPGKRSNTPACQQRSSHRNLPGSRCGRTAGNAKKMYWQHDDDESQLHLKEEKTKNNHHAEIFWPKPEMLSPTIWHSVLQTWENSTKTTTYISKCFISCTYTTASHSAAPILCCSRENSSQADSYHY